MVFLCLILSALLNCHWFNFSFTKKKKKKCTKTPRNSNMYLYYQIYWRYLYSYGIPSCADPEITPPSRSAYALYCNLLSRRCSNKSDKLFFSVDRSPFYWKVKLINIMFYASLVRYITSVYIFDRNM